MTQTSKIEYRIYLQIGMQLEALEKQMQGMATLRSLVQEVQHSVECLSASQSQLRGDVESHCSHSSALLTQIQACSWAPRVLKPVCSCLSYLVSYSDALVATHSDLF
jgi:hypothetical protein